MADNEAPADEKPTEIQTAPPKRPRGRPPKARGKANSADDPEHRWSVRGVPLNVRAIASRGAEKLGMTVGDWVSEAIVAFSRADRNTISAHGNSQVPAVDVSKTLDELSKRLTELEQRESKGFLVRLFGRR